MLFACLCVNSDSNAPECISKQRHTHTQIYVFLSDTRVCYLYLSCLNSTQ